MDDHPPRRRFSRGVGALLELAVALVLTAALLTVIEAGAGRLLRDTTAEERMSTAFAHARGDTVETTLMTLSMNPVPLVPDRELLWRNQPGAQRDVPANPRGIGRPETWHVAIDRSGYRGPDRSSGVESGPVYRILCIGDSITYGWGTDQDDVFPRRVEAILRERHPGADIEVTNAGVPGWSWIQGLRFLEREGLALRPDVVVMGHGTNDQLRIRALPISRTWAARPPGRTPSTGRETSSATRTPFAPWSDSAVIRSRDRAARAASRSPATVSASACRSRRSRARCTTSRSSPRRMGSTCC